MNQFLPHRWYSNNYIIICQIVQQYSNKHNESTYLPHYYIPISYAADSRNSLHFYFPKKVKIKAENTNLKGIFSIINIKLY